MSLLGISLLSHQPEKAYWAAISISSQRTRVGKFQGAGSLQFKQARALTKDQVYTLHTEVNMAS